MLLIVFVVMDGLIATDAGTLYFVRPLSIGSVERPGLAISP
jgi:hypothetical protein